MTKKKEQLSDRFAREMTETADAMHKLGIMDAQAHKLTMRELLEACRSASGSDASLTWVTDEFLQESEVAGWSEMPLWMPAEANIVNFLSVDCRKAIEAGLTFRSPIETARATLDWDRGRDTPELRAGLKREREEELLRVWHEKR